MLLIIDQFFFSTFLLLFLKILPKCDYPPPLTPLVSGNFDSSVGSKLIYFKVLRNFLLKERWTVTETAYFPFTTKAKLKYTDFSQYRNNFQSVFLLLHTNYLTQTAAVAFHAVQKVPTINKNVLTMFFHLNKERNKRTLWCRYGYLTFHYRVYGPKIQA